MTYYVREGTPLRLHKLINSVSLKARAPNREQFSDTNKLVNRIVRLTIETREPDR